MKKELASILLLVLLFAGSVFNIYYVDSLTRDIEEHIDQSQSLAQKQDYESAIMYHNHALERWLSADSYTHIFLRHTEIDLATDAFYELLNNLKEPEEKAVSAAYAKLKYHLESIRTMEHITLGSIF